MSHTLHTLPFELIVSILTFACADDVQTGCSTNRVCKTLRECCVNSGADLQYVSVNGLRKMEKFLWMIQKRAKATRRVVELSLVHEDADIQTRPHDRTVQISILKAISPRHLRTLTLIYASDFPPHTLLPVPFPNLRVFSLHVPLAVPPQSFLRTRIAPSVEKVFLGGRGLLRSGFGRELRRMCPGVKELELEVALPGTEGHAMEFLRAFVAPTVPSSSLTSDDDGSDVPPTLRSITVTFAPLDPCDVRTSYPTSAYRRRIEDFIQLAQETRRNARHSRISPSDDFDDSGNGGEARTLKVIPLLEIKKETREARLARTAIHTVDRRKEDPDERYRRRALEELALLPHSSWMSLDEIGRFTRRPTETPWSRTILLSAPLFFYGVFHLCFWSA